MKFVGVHKFTPTYGLIGRALDQSPQYWLNLQTTYDLKITKASLGELLDEVHLLVRV